MIYWTSMLVIRLHVVIRQSKRVISKKSNRNKRMLIRSFNLRRILYHQVNSILTWTMTQLVKNQPIQCIGMDILLMFIIFSDSNKPLMH